MSPDQVLELGVSTAWLVVILSAPPLIAASVVGLGVGLLQTLTQIQDAAFAYAFKIATVTLVLLVAGGWLGARVLEFTTRMLTDFPTLTR